MECFTTAFSALALVILWARTFYFSCCSLNMPLAILSRAFVPVLSEQMFFLTSWRYPLTCQLFQTTLHDVATTPGLVLSIPHPIWAATTKYHILVPYTDVLQSREVYFLVFGAWEVPGEGQQIRCLVRVDFWFPDDYLQPVSSPDTRGR